ncbi:hypothetical protein MYX76_02635 [Desulfobacterota bacterium AH_259_B03_O07]|nr:hypothetical protein [Desulfobacterota bacterium AH_259_B03_O07]
MKELMKGEDYHNRSGRICSREHRVSFVIPKSNLIWSARLISNRKLVFDLKDDEIRCQAYLRKVNRVID